MELVKHVIHKNCNYYPDLFNDNIVHYIDNNISHFNFSRTNCLLNEKYMFIILIPYPYLKGLLHEMFWNFFPSSNSPFWSFPKSVLNSTFFCGVIKVLKQLPGVWDTGESIRNNKVRKIFKTWAKCICIVNIDSHCFWVDCWFKVTVNCLKFGKSLNRRKTTPQCHDSPSVPDTRELWLPVSGTLWSHFSSV